MSTLDVVVALTTLPPDADAAAFARRLVDDRLAACVSLLPAMQSVYRWEGQLEAASERQVLIKTTREQLDALFAVVCDLHPFDVPEWIVLAAAGGSDTYFDWVRASTS
jgi:periplasmic divalent cation tolerance protein